MRFIDYGLLVIFLIFAVSGAWVLYMAAAYTIFNIIQKRVIFIRRENRWNRFIDYYNLENKWDEFKRNGD